MILVILEILFIFSAGVATGIFFRSQITSLLHTSLGWVKKSADDVDKKL